MSKTKQIPMHQPYTVPTISKDSLPKELQNKYVHPVVGYDPVSKSYVKVLVDTYAIDFGFNQKLPAAVIHAQKKLFQPGCRGAKGYLEDLVEARDSLNRAIQQEEHKKEGFWELG